MGRINYFLLILSLNFLQAYAAEGEKKRILHAQNAHTEYDLLPYLEILPDSIAATYLGDSENVDFNSIDNYFQPLIHASVNTDAQVHWMRFTMQNAHDSNDEFKLNILFTDRFTLYESTPDGQYIATSSGDMVPIDEREVTIGQFCFVRFNVPPSSTRTFYIRLESASGISQQFKDAAIHRITLYPEPSFVKQYISPRIYQSAFYGAIITMLLYNLYIYFSLGYLTYLYFAFFIFSLIVFQASNTGYIIELLFPSYPRFDLYIRLGSIPVVAFFYILFSKTYLKTDRSQGFLNALMNFLLGVYSFIFAMMCLGFWKWGRLAIILFVIIGLFSIMVIAIRALTQGFTPARYFVAANLMFLLSAILMAIQRLLIIEIPFISYSFQVFSLLEIALFSMGLTDRINRIQQQLAAKTLEALELKNEQIIERKRITEEKNRELENKVLERTAEVITQKEEIEAQNDYLAQVNEELSSSQEIIENQNRQLAHANQFLESTVQERTSDLNKSNEKLQKVVHELDTFIYRTAHDIRGPLARLIGLCQVAIIDVKDAPALDYFDKINFVSHNLDYILSRLQTIHEINHAAVKGEIINFEELKQNLESKVKYMECFHAIHPRIDIQAAQPFVSDSSFLLFILQNLVENALKFHPPESRNPFVSVAIHTTGHRLTIRVTDNGSGIRKEDMPFIFNMFSRAASRYKSAGMGLYMVKLVVEKLNGNITLNENKEQRTEFYIELPSM